MGMSDVPFLRRRMLTALPLAFPLAAQQASQPAAGDAGIRTYNVRAFGAKGDGTTLDTAAVQSAIDACARDRGGTVLIPAGDFVVGTIELKTNVTLHLCGGGRLLGSDK